MGISSSVTSSIVALVLFLFAPAASAETYYVDGDEGDDSYDGLAESYEGGVRGPRRTWAWLVFVNDSVVTINDGDRILFKRGTTFTRQEAGVDMRLSNIDDVYFGAYGDESLPRPVFDSQGEMGLHIGYNGPTSGLTFEDLKWITSEPRPSGEMITAFSDDDEEGGHAEGVTFRRIEVDATNETGTQVSDETVTFTANNVTIEDCYIHDGGRTGIYVAGKNNLFQRNVIENFLVGLKLNHGNGGWGVPSEVVIRRNLIINSGVSIELGVCENNDIYGNVMIGIGHGPGEDGRQFGIQIEGDAHDNNFFNNTVIMNGEGDDHHGVRMYQEAGEGNVVQNNLIYFYNDDDDDDYLFYQGNTALMPDADYNLYFTDGPTRWYRDGTLYSSLEEWRATDGTPDQNSILVDPQFESSPDGVGPHDVSIKLASTSPAINSGAPIQMHTTLPYMDFFGNSYVGLPDMGAFEFGVAPTCDGETCAEGQECAGGSLDGLCCVGGTCSSPSNTDAGPGADAEPNTGCSCRVGSEPSLPFPLLLLLIGALVRIKIRKHAR